MAVVVSPRQRLRATEPSTRSLKTVRLCGIRFAQFYRKPTLFFGPVMVGVSI
mgnify:CR=1 FL=1